MELSGKYIWLLSPRKSQLRMILMSIYRQGLQKYVHLYVGPLSNMRHSDARTLEERSSVHAYPPANNRNGVRQSSDTCASGFQHKLARGLGPKTSRRGCVRKTKHFLEACALVFFKEHFTSSGLASNGTGRIAGLSGSMECLFIRCEQTNGMGLTNLCCLESFLASLHYIVWI